MNENGRFMHETWDEDDEAAIDWQEVPQQQPFPVLAKLRALLVSRRFWLFASVMGMLVLRGPLGIADGDATKIAVMVAAWILGDSIRQTK